MKGIDNLDVEVFNLMKGIDNLDDEVARVAFDIRRPGLHSPS
ncbi:MAG TPA: hypothetical protein VGQ46_15640 [Thermoanaerobaculia bacterium]|nr:hypothetical protein [Thermoanaerobaculia bacterium]